MRLDHVIIGAGINALMAGAMLTLKGQRVVLLERSDVIGGCLRTKEITLPGFQHDVMTATFALFKTGLAGDALGPHLARRGFEYCHSPHPTAVLRPDGSSLVLTMDRAKNISAFKALALGDDDAHAAVVGGIERDAPFLFALLAGSLWSWATAKLLFGQIRQRGMRGLAAWFGQALVPARGWLETSFQNPLVKALFAPWMLHCGLTPESTYSGKMTKVVAFALEPAGAPIVKGGAGKAAEAFRKLIEEMGGQLRTGADVHRILVRDGRVTGVVSASGEEIFCGSVLASVAPAQLHERPLREANLPEDKAAAKVFRHGRGDFHLHYALDKHPGWLTAGLDDVALIHLSDEIDAVSKSANEAERGMLAAVPTICVEQPHRLNPTRCPEGKAILWIQVPDAPCEIKGDSGGEISGRDWSDVREAYADRIEAILAQYIKGFCEIQLARRAYSPADIETMNVNLFSGDPYGGICSIDQFFIWRPYAHSRNGVSQLSGLIHIGAFTHPGPRLSGGSGFLAAKRLGA